MVTNLAFLFRDFIPNCFLPTDVLAIIGRGDHLTVVAPLSDEKHFTGVRDLAMPLQNVHGGHSKGRISKGTFQKGEWQTAQLGLDDPIWRNISAML